MPGNQKGGDHMARKKTIAELRIERVKAEQVLKLRQGYRQSPHEHCMAAASGNPGKVLKEDAAGGGIELFSYMSSWLLRVCAKRAQKPS